MLGKLLDGLSSNQGRMFLCTRAVGLRIERGHCVGIEVRRGDERFEIDARATVIAEGGFPDDAELFRKHIGPQPDRALMRHTGTAIGDRLKMAEAAGAATIGFSRFYGHLLGRDAMDNPGCGPTRKSMPSRLRQSSLILPGSAGSTKASAAFRSPMIWPASMIRFARP